MATKEEFATAVAIARNHALYNPAVPGSPEWVLWEAGVVWGLLGKNCPPNATGAGWEGWEYGKKLKEVENDA
ncbi:MAG: hypothetical protein AAFX78_10065 [Cyanobacteria bacterium J06638_20]